MKAAIIENGKVINIAKVTDQAFADSQGWVVSDTAKVGDDYDETTGEFITPTPPPPPTPTVITRRQGKQQLVIAGIDADVETAINNITDAAQQKLMQIWYNDSNTWERDSQQLQSLASTLGLTDTQLDDLFKAASKL